MKIAVYQTADDVPDHLRFVAQYIVGGKFAPVYVNGKTREEAYQRAVEFWEKHSEDIQRGKRPARAAKVKGDDPAEIPVPYDPLEDL